MAYETRLASLMSYQKGRVDVIDDDPKNYAFSNIFEVASLAKPFEQVAVAKNFEYVLEAVRAYRLASPAPAVVLIQTVAGPDTQFRWAEICQTA